MGAAYLLDRARHGLLLAALLCVLVARTAVPAGWMPMAAADGSITLAPCSGMGAMSMVGDQASPAPTGHGMSGMTMAGMAAGAVHEDGADKSDTRHPDPAGDHPCSGAGVSVALELPAPGILIAPVSRAYAAPRQVSAVAVGRGLAAPPPWQTGPPLLA